jgi:hypothetical protein
LGGLEEHGFREGVSQERIPINSVYLEGEVGGGDGGGDGDGDGGGSLSQRFSGELGGVGGGEGVSRLRVSIKSAYLEGEVGGGDGGGDGDGESGFDLSVTSRYCSEPWNLHKYDRVQESAC